MKTSTLRLRRIHWNPIRVDRCDGAKDFSDWLGRTGLDAYFDWLWFEQDLITVTNEHTTTMLGSIYDARR